MIAPMKKVSIVLLDNDKQNSLKSLKKLGVMHLSEKFGLNEDVKAVDEQIKEVETALKFTEEAAADHSKEFDESEVLVSEKDAKLPFFSEFVTPFTN